MSADQWSRRGVLASLAALAALAAPRPAAAASRTPSGGRLTFRLPWSVATIDPHRVDDALAAILGEALFDTLYAKEDAGFAPALAEGDPQPDPGGLTVTVRAGLRTAAGKALDARDVAASLARARTRGARAWLAAIAPPRVRGKLTLVFPTKDAPGLVRALASPLTAVVPSGFAPERPDGTGAFRAERRDGALVLARNPLAARGPAFLAEVVLRAAPDLAASLRAFESGADDLGWLGTGLHEPRPNARTFDGGAVALALLRTGREAGAWDAPGVAQRIADGIPHARLSHLAVGSAWPAEAEQSWGGAPCELLVREDAPWLVEVARAVAASVTRPGHEVGVRALSPTDFAQRRLARTFALAMDVARPLEKSPLGVLVGLATADDAQAAEDVARHPPRLGDVTPRVLARTLRVGVVGEVRVQGGRAAEIALPLAASGFGMDFGGAARR